ncbi:MAG: hypothetical protein U9Q70_12765 [Chloroflexota bacterium]|nr:hypothetical protein [Chloroflexota bacterium]
MPFRITLVINAQVVRNAIPRYSNLSMRNLHNFPTMFCYDGCAVMIKMGRAG